MRIPDSAAADGAARTLLELPAERLPQALLIEGPQEGATREIAMAIARAVVCRSGANAPCEKCPACLKSAAGVHPDIYILDRPEADVRVDDIRELRADAHVLPNESDRKAFVIFNAENMNHYAQNALLKTLEEPPARAVFILTAENRALLLQTVLSRVIVFSIPPKPGPADERENRPIRAAAGEYVQALASGSRLDIFEKLILLDGKPRETMQEFLEAVCFFIRNAVFLKAGLLSEVPAVFQKGAQALSGAFSANQLLEAFGFFSAATEDCRKNAGVASLIGLAAAYGDKLYRRIRC